MCVVWGTECNTKQLISQTKWDCWTTISISRVQTSNESVLDLVTALQKINILMQINLFCMSNSGIRIILMSLIY